MADKPAAFSALCRAHVLTRTLRAPSLLAEVATKAGSACGLAERTFLRRWLRTGFEHPLLLMEVYEMNHMRMV